MPRKKCSCYTTFFGPKVSVGQFGMLSRVKYCVLCQRIIFPEGSRGFGPDDLSLADLKHLVWMVDKDNR